MDKKEFAPAPVSVSLRGNRRMKILGCRQIREDRQEKIASLSDAIKNNLYRIDCRKLADCLIASLLLGML